MIRYHAVFVLFCYSLDHNGLSADALPLSVSQPTIPWISLVPNTALLKPFSGFDSERWKIGQG